MLKWISLFLRIDLNLLGKFKTSYEGGKYNLQISKDPIVTFWSLCFTFIYVLIPFGRLRNKILGFGNSNYRRLYHPYRFSFMFKTRSPISKYLHIPDVADLHFDLF